MESQCLGSSNPYFTWPPNTRIVMLAICVWQRRYKVLPLSKNTVKILLENTFAQLFSQYNCSILLLTVVPTLEIKILLYLYMYS